ncbi:MAG TPA: DUF433 domain-containing protein, partial [Bryobacteraceae bacterium]|nr:DUF433 domain-containing protein [Bryobacteraceae bacterium]
VSSEEKIDWSGCPLVEIKPGVQSGAPVLRGTRMPVSAIVDNFDYDLSVACASSSIKTFQLVRVPSRRGTNSIQSWKWKLLELAEQSGFDVMVTSDQNIRYQQNIAGWKLAPVVLGSNIWPVVQKHGAAICASVDAATPGSYACIEMPLPPKPRRTAAEP